MKIGVDGVQGEIASGLGVGSGSGGDLEGPFPGPTVVGIRGIPVCVTAPVLGQALVFDGTEWCPTTLPSGSVTIKDEGTPLATGATSLDFVGAGVTATGAGAAKTITIPGGAAVLDDLTDVTLTTPAIAQRLRFDGSVWRNSSLIWAPMMTLDPGTGNYLVLTDTSGNAIMAEV